MPSGEKYADFVSARTNVVPFTASASRPVVPKSSLQDRLLEKKNRLNIVRRLTFESRGH